MDLYTLKLFVILFLFKFSKNDIPTHCLSHQIVGEWIFYQTEAVSKELSELYNFKCGIKDHTNIEEIDKFNMHINLFKNSIKIRFNKNHEAQIIESKGFSMNSNVLDYFFT